MAPFRKLTGLVAIITRTAPVGPITRWPSARESPPRRPGVSPAADAHRHAANLNLDLHQSTEFPLECHLATVT